MVVSKIFPTVSLGILAFFVCLDRSSAQSDWPFTPVNKEGEYKFVVAVTSKAGVCTGTILNRDWILTAAHCFYYRGKLIEEKDARILAGIVNYEVPNSRTKFETMSAKIVVHPWFWLNRIAKFDVALVRLRDTMEFNEFIDKAEIAGDEWPQSENETANCLSLGFGGYRSIAPPTKDLKAWNVTAGHGEDACPCARRFQYKRLVCVKESQYPLTCKGDDGGPLVCGNVVRAIAHMVWNRFTCDDPTYPLEKCVGHPDKGLTTYTFLCPLNNWMRVLVPEVPPTPKSCRAAHLSLPRAGLLVYLFIWLLQL